MHGLNKKQRKLVKSAFLKYVRENGKYPLSSDDLEKVEAIEAVNSSEVFYQCVDRMLGDLALEDKLKKGGLNEL